jgi:molybdopterin converting factor subunit 1
MRVLYFAWLRSKTGVAEEEVAAPAEVRTVGQLVAWLRHRSPGHEEAFAKIEAVRAAVNQSYADLDHAVAADDEIAFFPPVTGG